jgi:hypothetical protein
MQEDSESANLYRRQCWSTQAWHLGFKELINKIIAYIAQDGK